MSTFKFITILFLLINSVVFSQTTITHSVVKGENISVIAKKYGVNPSEIYTLNPKVEGNLLQINAVLFIPNKRDSISNNSLFQLKEHKVIAGESLYKISKQYNIPLQELKRLNPEVVKKLPIGYSLILKEEIPIVEIDTMLIANEIIHDSIKTFVEISKVDLLIESASKNLGTKYKRGGTNSKGFDCSGFTYTTYKTIAITLPRSSYEQAKIGTKIEPSKAQKGDLIFFSTNNKKTINHVGMITEVFDDEIKFIHSSTQLGVVISSTKEPYYSKRIVQVNRIL